MEISFANLLVIAHVSFGALALCAGTVALTVRKGSALHVNVGRIFACAMISSSALGALLGVLRLEQFYITFHAGILGVTLIASGWLSARNTTSERTVTEHIVSVLNLINTICLIGLGVYALGLADGIFLGFAGEDYLFLAFLAGLAACFDISLWFRNTISNHHRIARHLWRMCLGFFIAAGSAFTGPGGKAFPQAVQQSGLLSLPELLIFLAMVFWLIRVIFTDYAKISTVADSS
ncbi:hypothetical protein [Hyphococcus lacteus]|uniref:DUF2306 domain-containing protein n=1 Tax=Hyphococcus lacteus TaxID=3143536 RepID=A0ABV3Z7K0_9PROT